VSFSLGGFQSGDKQSVHLNQPCHAVDLQTSRSGLTISFVTEDGISAERIKIDWWLLIAACREHGGKEHPPLSAIEAHFSGLGEKNDH